MFGPTISESSEEWRNDFYVPNESLPNDDFNLFQWKGGNYVCNISEKWSASSGSLRYTSLCVRLRTATARHTASGASTSSASL